MIDGAAVDGWRVMPWRDLRAHLIFWRIEIAERSAGERDAERTAAAQAGTAGFPSGPPRLGKISFPQDLIDRLPVDDIGQG